jgi:hypothetical protein
LRPLLLFDPPLLEEDEDEPPLFDPPLLEEDEDEPPLFDPLLRDDDEPLDPPELRDEDDEDELPPLLEPLLRDDDPPLLFDAVLRDGDDPPLLFEAVLRDDDERELPPDDEPDVLVLRREVLRCSFRPRPALKLTVVRSGMRISVPVRGLRPVRAARVRRVNFPKPGMDSDPAACTASEMAPDAVSKMASTTRAAAALVSSAFSATASMNSDLFMFGSPSGAMMRRGPSAPHTHDANSVPHLLGRTLDRLASPPPLPAVEPRAEAVHDLARRVGGLPEGLLSAFAVRL